MLVGSGIEQSINLLVRCTLYEDRMAGNSGPLIWDQVVNVSSIEQSIYLIDILGVKALRAPNLVSQMWNQLVNASWFQC
jgi:hypothetical protein